MANLLDGELIVSCMGIVTKGIVVGDRSHGVNDEAVRSHQSDEGWNALLGEAVEDNSLNSVVSILGRGMHKAKHDEQKRKRDASWHYSYIELTFFYLFYRHIRFV